jgi:hypothetical protein
MLRWRSGGLFTSLSQVCPLTANGSAMSWPAQSLKKLRKNGRSGEI